MDGLKDRTTTTTINTTRTTTTIRITRINTNKHSRQTHEKLRITKETSGLDCYNLNGGRFVVVWTDNGTLTRVWIMCVCVFV